MSLSDIIPRARIKINNGTGFFTFGTTTTICSLLKTEVGATIFTAVVRIGLEESSDTERISAE